MTIHTTQKAREYNKIVNNHPQNKKYNYNDNKNNLQPCRTRTNKKCYV